MICKEPFVVSLLMVSSSHKYFYHRKSNHHGKHARNFGHIKNVANFEDYHLLYRLRNAIQSKQRNHTQIANLTTLRTNAQNSIASVTASKTAFSNATSCTTKPHSTRSKKHSTRVVNALDATDATDKLVKDAKHQQQNSRQTRRRKTKTSFNSKRWCRRRQIHFSFTTILRQLNWQFW